MGSPSFSWPASAPRSIPPLTDLDRAFWTGGADGELRIMRCGACRRWIHPAAPTCPRCGSGEVAAEATSGRATVFTYTVNRHVFNPSVPVPVVIAIVELVEQEGLKFTTNIVGCDPEAVTIGMPVRAVFEQHGEAWVPVFRPE